MGSDVRAQVYEKAYNFTDGRAQVSGQSRSPFGAVVEGTNGNFPAADHRVPALTGKAAEIDLRSKGQYESLAAAFHAAQYAVEKINPSTPCFRGAEFFAANPKQKLRAFFGSNGVELNGKARINGNQEPWTLTFRLQSYGRSGNLKAIEARSVHADENRVEIAGPTEGLVEWWENKDSGFEHGFTIKRSPQGNGPVEFAIAAEGTLCIRQPGSGDNDGIAFVTNDGQPVARYGLIKAWDAKGCSLPVSIDLVGEQLALRVSDAGATYPITIDPLFAAVETDLNGNSDLTGALLGSSVAIDGDTIAVTAPADKDPTGAQTGSVYVFERLHGPNDSVKWRQTAKFYGHNDTEGFGSALAASSVAIKGNVIVVGAPNASKAYVFYRTGETWTEQTSLTSGVPGDNFGGSVALDGPPPFLTELFTGGTDSNDTHNQSFLFVPSSTTAQYTMSRQAASAFPTDPTGGTVLAESDDSFAQFNLAASASVKLYGVPYTSFFVGSNGYITFVNGDTTFAESIANHYSLPRISALFDDLTPTGGAQISVKQLSDRVAVTWQNVRLISNNAPNNFQVEMFFDGRIRITLLNIAATGGLIGLSPGGGVPAGFAETNFTAPYTTQIRVSGNPYMFAGDNLGWVSQGQLNANDGTTLAGAGAVSGNTAIVTPNFASTNVYVFTRTNGAWTQQAKLGPDPMTSDTLGRAVSIDGDTILVGGGFVGPGTSKGAYFFKRNGITWSIFQKLQGQSNSDSLFGTAVALNGNTAIIGAPAPINNNNGAHGAAYVYTLTGGQWSNTATLTIAGGQQSLHGGNTILDTDFGSSVALSGSTIVVGAPYYDTAAGEDAGNATVFVPDPAAPSNWVAQQTLDGTSEVVAGTKFGYSLAVSGDTALIGAPESETEIGANSGSVYVFVRQNGLWQTQAKLFAEPITDGPNIVQDFGEFVAVDGDTAIVSAPATSSFGNGPNAFVFVRTGTAWSEQAELLPGAGSVTGVAVSGNNALVGDFGLVRTFTRIGTNWTQDASPIMPAVDNSIGPAIAVSGTTAVIGASSKAYVFSKGQAGWSQNAVLTPSDGALGFGTSVAIDGTTILVGAPNGTSGPGSAYPFILNSGTWQQQGKLTAADGMTGDNFGGSVSVKGNVAAVGAPEAGAFALTNPGNAYLFARNAGSWTQQTKLTSGFDRAPGDSFGFSVALTSTNTVSSFDSILGEISAPFTIDAANRLISQPSLTTNPAQGGKAVYTFTVDNPGDYTITAQVNWPDASSNSFFAAVDAEPTTSNIWTGTTTSGLESRPLTWGAETTAHVFTLTAGSHSLIVRGRSANAKLGRISINVGGSPSSLALVGAPGISGAAGDVYAYLLGDLPQITVQPVSQTVLKASPVTFNVTATGFQPLNYQWRKNGIDISGATGPSYTIPSTDTPDSGNYDVVVSNIGGVVTSASAVLNVNVLSALAQAFPSPPLDAQGFVIVTLTPSGIQSGWRFLGEQLWRPPGPGTVVGGLTSGDRQIEFRPVPGYIQPLTETITVTSGASATQVTEEYFPTGSGQSGSLEVILKPDSIADPGLFPVANRAQWRFLGEDDNQWRNSGVTVNGLLPGKYLIESKPISGRNTPSPIVVPVQSNPNPTALATITYYSADATVGATPSVLPFQTVSTTQSLPYAYVGQIRSDVGSATGFVVNRRVVATAGHVVFDDGATQVNGQPTYVTGLQWLFQRDAGTYDPVPQIPQGFYVFGGYAAQRTAENTPGQSTVASQNLDVAALYFPADAGRGGYAGYLASDSTDNEFLTSSSLKMVVGYPVNGIPSAQQGRMFATSPSPVTFTRVPGTDSSNNPYRVYTTQDITSAGGNSGGPICIQVNNIYYPAAIYLGGSAQTSVRAIDSKVVDLFGRAQVSADGGANQVGGGIIQVNTPLSGGNFSAAGMLVTITPTAAVNAGAAWKLSPTDVPFPSGFERDNLNPAGAYTLYFTPATGFLTPPSVSVTLTGGSVANISRTYFGITTQPQDKIASVGSAVTFSIVTSGTPTGYQWRRNGINISGATGSSYTINSVMSSDTATYSVVATWQEFDLSMPPNSIGFVSQTSSAANLTVTDTFNSWSSRFFTPTELNNPQISGATADPEGDGIANLLEFAFNLQPRIADRSVIVAGAGTSGLPLIRLETINNQKVLTIEFIRRRAAGSPGITYHAEFNGDLTNPSGWSETGTSTVTQIDDTWERVKVTDSLTNQTKRFGRVRLTMP